jgi:hypothetical protein
MWRRVKWGNVGRAAGALAAVAAVALWPDPEEGAPGPAPAEALGELRRQIPPAGTPATPAITRERATRVREGRRPNPRSRVGHRTEQPRQRSAPSPRLPAPGLRQPPARVPAPAPGEFGFERP